MATAAATAPVPHEQQHLGGAVVDDDLADRENKGSDRRHEPYDRVHRWSFRLRPSRRRTMQSRAATE